MMDRSTSKTIFMSFAALWLVALCHAGIPWLISEDEKHSWRSGPSEKCYFARKWYDIGQSFQPHLNPFGLMPCMNCTCRKNPQFPFLKPRVTCHNIRNSCPLVFCADPVIKKGECCPTCHDEFVGNLLISRISPVQNNSLFGRIHITVSRKTMYISLHIEGFEAVTQLKLRAKDDQLMQIISDKDIGLNSHGKICFESKISDLQLEKLRHSGDIIAEVLLNNSIQLAGVLTPFSKFSEVPFIALLNANENTKQSYIRGGFIGLLPDIYSDRITIHSLLAPENSASKSDAETTLVTIKVLKRPWKADKKSQLVKSFSFELLNSDLEAVAAGGPRSWWGRIRNKFRHGAVRILFHTTEYPIYEYWKSESPILRRFDWLRPRAAHLRWMVRGILFVAVEVEGVNQETHLFGRVMVQQTCNNLFSVLSGGDLSPSVATSGSGSISVSVDAKAKIHFKASGRSIAKAEKVDLIAFDEDDVLIKKLATVRRSPDEDNFEIIGTWERPTAKAISLIFNGGFIIKVVSQVEPKGYMAGRIRQFMYLPEADYSKGSILSVHDVSTTVKTNLAATALLSVDASCNLHYVVIIGGYGESSSAYRMIEGKLVIDAIYARRRNTGKGIKLASFNKNYISRGSFIKPSIDMLNGIASGMAHIQINTRRFATGELKGHISLASSKCSKVKVINTNAYLHRSLSSTDGNFGVCLHGGRFYDNGGKWHPLSKDGLSRMYCRTCRCKQRVVTCSDIICPKPSCLNPAFVRENCCPVCTGPPNGKNVDPANACIIGMASRNEIRAIGEAWHPMMPPFGMVRCIVCICKSAPGGYTCRRVKCPKLKCRNPQRTPGSCCPTCPAKALDSRITELQDTVPRDLPSSRRKKQGCTYNKEFHSHGTSWKPILPQFGILRCVICRCKNGRVRCRRLKCLKSARCRMRNGRIPSDPCCRHCTIKKTN